MYVQFLKVLYDILQCFLSSVAFINQLRKTFYICFERALKDKSENSQMTMFNHIFWEEWVKEYGVVQTPCFCILCFLCSLKQIL